MEEKQNEKALKVIHFAIDTFLFLAGYIVLICFQFAFQKDLLWPFIFHIIGVLLYYRYYCVLKNTFIRRKTKYTIIAEILLIIAMWLVSSAVSYMFVNTFGYFEISPILRR